MPPVCPTARLLSVVLLLLAMALLAVPQRTHAQTILTATTVTELVSDITTANGASPSAYTINLIAGTTYTLMTADGNDPLSGLPQITGAITLNGNGATIRRSPAAQNFRIVAIGAGGTLNLNAVTLQGGSIIGAVGTIGSTGSAGNPNGGGGDAGSDGVGGAIRNDGTLVVTSSTFMGNSVTGGAGGRGGNGFNNPAGPGGSGGGGGAGGKGIGGAVAGSGALTIVNSTFTGNTALGGTGGDGGGAGVGSSATGPGGSGASGGDGQGGAIASIDAGTLTVINSTIAGVGTTTNSAAGGSGGSGVSPGGTGAGSGGGVSNGGATPNSARLTNTLLASNVAASGMNCAGNTLVDGGHNLELGPSTSCQFTKVNQSGDPLLGPLQNNGGPTQTMAIGGSGAARGNGDSAICTANPVGGVDQRGLPRPSGQCGIGAFEWHDAPTLSTIAPLSGPVEGGSRVTLGGTGFLPGATVQFDAAFATNVTVNDAQTITLTTPPHGAAMVSLTVTNPDLQAISLSTAYHYGVLNPLPAPKPTAPSAGSPLPLPPTRPAGAAVMHPNPLPLPRP